MKERKIACLNCKSDKPKEIFTEDRNLISYRCLECGANVFDKLEDENDD